VFLSLSDWSNSSTYLWFVILYYPLFHSTSKALSWVFCLYYGVFLSRISKWLFQNFYIFIEFLLHIPLCLPCLIQMFIWILFEFIQFFICILFEFIQVLIHILFNFINHSYNYSFKFIIWNFMCSPLLNSFIVEFLTFGRDLLPCFFILLVFLGWDLHVWGQVVGWKL
jgi:hypothetical protein